MISTLEIFQRGDLSLAVTWHLQQKGVLDRSSTRVFTKLRSHFRSQVRDVCVEQKCMGTAQKTGNSTLLDQGSFDASSLGSKN